MSSSSGLARQTLLERGLRLEYASVGWMVVEAGVAIWAGVQAASIALVAFGLDSVIELFAALVVIAELRRGGRTETEERAVRIIGVTFFVLAAYVSVVSSFDLVKGAQPESSMVGILVAAAALLVMPALALGKRQVGRALDSDVLLADAAETAFCALLSGAALAGLILNGAAGLWWADPLAGLVIAGLAVKEGFEAVRGEDDDRRGAT